MLLHTEDHTYLITRGDSKFQSAPPARHAPLPKTTVCRARFCFRKLFNFTLCACREADSFITTNRLSALYLISSDTKTCQSLLGGL